LEAIAEQFGLGYVPLPWHDIAGNRKDKIKPEQKCFFPNINPGARRPPNDLDLQTRPSEGPNTSSV